MCATQSETSCTTRRGETRCVRTPLQVLVLYCTVLYCTVLYQLQVCGAGCRTTEGAEECREEEVDTLQEVPQEICDIIPHKICQPVTRLVPALKPSQECAMVPSEVCSINYGNKRVVEKPLKTEWCLDQDSQL